jgi:DNA-directed RNA polymerase III subunit RPC2
VRTRQQAVVWLASKLRNTPRRGTDAAAREQEVHDTVANVIIAHVPPDARNGSMRRKAIFLAMMVRRLMRVETGDASVDDQDFFGNKRLELAGSLLALLFEDLFKRFNEELRRMASKLIPKVKAEPFDVTKHMRPDLITNALVVALSSGRQQ